MPGWSTEQATEQADLPQSPALSSGVTVSHATWPFYNENNLRFTNSQPTNYCHHGRDDIAPTLCCSPHGCHQPAEHHRRARDQHSRTYPSPPPYPLHYRHRISNISIYPTVHSYGNSTQPSTTPPRSPSLSQKPPPHARKC